MEPASSHPNGVSTKIINQHTRPSVIKTHHRRCEAAGNSVGWNMERR
jgi:hypothetical protein